MRRQSNGENGIFSFCTLELELEGKEFAVNEIC